MRLPGDAAAPLGGGDSRRAATDRVGTAASPTPARAGWPLVADSRARRGRFQPRPRNGCSADSWRAAHPAPTADRGRSCESGARTSSPASDRARAVVRVPEYHRSNGPPGSIEPRAAAAGAPATVHRWEEIRPPHHLDTSCAAPSAARLSHRRQLEEANDLRCRRPPPRPVRSWPGSSEIRPRSRFFAPPPRNFNSPDR